jgi:hypothetical protein
MSDVQLLNSICYLLTIDLNNLKTQMQKTLPSFAILSCIAFVLSSCEPKATERRTGRITDIPDTTLAHFSYSLIPNWAQHKSTSFYDYRMPIVETKGSFTSPVANEVLVAVPYLSSEVPFTKLFLVKLSQTGFEMIDWFSLDCTKFSVQDLNHDRVDEIVAEHEGVLSNVTPYKTFELISLKNNEVKIFYQSYSQDESKVFHKDTHKVGDTLSTWIDNRLIDQDNDSTFEMMERIKYTTIEEISGNEFVKTRTRLDSVVVKVF